MMRKAICLILVLVLCISALLPVLASAKIFIPSRDLEIQSAAISGQDVSGSVIITTVPAAEKKETDIADEDREQLLKLYEALSEETMKLVGDGDPQYLELFDIRGALTDEMFQQLEQEGVTLSLQFKQSVEEGTRVMGLCYVDGHWVPAVSTTHDNGVITVVVEQAGPVVLLLLSEQLLTTENPTVSIETVTTTETVEDKTTFVPSITYKGTPKVVSAETNMVTEGMELGQEGILNCIVVTSIAQAKNKSTDISQEERDLLLSLYEELTEGESKLPVEKDYVVRELLDVSFLFKGCQTLESHGDKEGNLAEVGTTVTVTFDMNVSEDAHIIVMGYADGKWAPIESVANNGDGTVTCVFEKIGPVAFIVDESADTESPYTGDAAGNQLGLWIGLMAVCAAGVVVLVILKKKQK